MEGEKGNYDEVDDVEGWDGWMTKMLSGANLPPIEALMDGDLQEWQGAPATTSGRHRFILDRPQS